MSGEEIFGTISDIVSVLGFSPVRLEQVHKEYKNKIRIE